MEALLSNIYILGLVAGLIGAIGDLMLNQYADRGGIIWLIAGYIIWILTATIFVFLLRGEIFGRGVVIFLLANIAFALVISRMFFTERLSPLQWFGIIAAMGLIALLSQGK